MKIDKTYDLPFSVEHVFSAWISDDYSVFPVTTVQVDPRVGGVFRLKIGSGDRASEMKGDVLKIEPGKSLQYTWHWGGDSSPSVVKAQFSKRDGGCRIEVSHSGLESAESATVHAEGWDSYVRGLERLLGKTKVSMEPQGSE